MATNSAATQADGTKFFELIFQAANPKYSKTDATAIDAAMNADFTTLRDNLITALNAITPTKPPTAPATNSDVVLYDLDNYLAFTSAPTATSDALYYHNIQGTLGSLKSDALVDTGAANYQAVVNALNPFLTGCTPLARTGCTSRLLDVDLGSLPVAYIAGSSSELNNRVGAAVGNATVDAAIQFCDQFRQRMASLTSTVAGRYDRFVRSAIASARIACSAASIDSTDAAEIVAAIEEATSAAVTHSTQAINY